MSLALLRTEIARHRAGQHVLGFAVFNVVLVATWWGVSTLESPPDDVFRAILGGLMLGSMLSVAARVGLERSCVYALHLPLHGRSLVLVHWLAQILLGTLPLAAAAVAVAFAPPVTRPALLTTVVNVFGGGLAGLAVFHAFGRERAVHPSEGRRPWVLVFGAFTVAMIPLLSEGRAGAAFAIGGCVLMAWTWWRTPAALVAEPDTRRAAPARSETPARAEAADAPTADTSATRSSEPITRARHEVPSHAATRVRARPGPRVLRGLLLRASLAWPHPLVMIEGLFFVALAMFASLPLSGGSGLSFPALAIIGLITFALVTTGFSVTAAALRRLGHLPMPRRTVFAYAALPSLAWIALALGAGAWALRDTPASDVIVLHARSEVSTPSFARHGAPKSSTRLDVAAIDRLREGDTLDVRIPVWQWRIAREEAVPAARAPWGETAVPHSMPLAAFGPWRVYNPYGLAPDSSPRFVAWQLARAFADATGRTPSPDVVAAFEAAVPGEAVTLTLGRSEISFADDDTQLGVLRPPRAVAVATIALAVWALTLFLCMGRPRSGRPIRALGNVLIAITVLAPVLLVAPQGHAIFVRTIDEGLPASAPLAWLVVALLGWLVFEGLARRFTRYEERVTLRPWLERRLARI